VCYDTQRLTRLVEFILVLWVYSYASESAVNVCFEFRHWTSKSIFHEMFLSSCWWVDSTKWNSLYSTSLPQVEPGRLVEVVSQVDPGRLDDVISQVDPGQLVDVISQVDPGQLDEVISQVDPTWWGYLPGWPRSTCWGHLPGWPRSTWWGYLPGLVIVRRPRLLQTFTRNSAFFSTACVTTESM